MGTNKIISIFNMLLYQPIGELYYFNIPLVKYYIQERSLSTYSETGSKLSTQFHYILDCVQKRLLCTYSPLYILHPCIFQNVYCNPLQGWKLTQESQTLVPPGWKVNLLPPGWNPSNLR